MGSCLAHPLNQMTLTGFLKPFSGSKVTISNQDEKKAQREAQDLRKGAEAGTELVSQFFLRGEFKLDHNS